MSRNIDPFRYFSLDSVAEKLSDNKRNLKKNLEKAQVSLISLPRPSKFVNHKSKQRYTWDAYLTVPRVRIL